MPKLSSSDDDPIAEAAAELWYSKLAARDPEPKTLFKTNIAKQVSQTSGSPHLTLIGRRQ